MLEIKIDYKQPIPIKEFTASLTAFGNSFERFCADTSVNGDTFSFGIKEVRKGSTIIDLVAMTNHVHEYVGVLSAANDAIGHTAQFAKYVTNGWDWLRGNKSKPQDYTKSEISDFHDMVAPAASSSNTTINIGVNNGTINNYIVNSEAANTIQRRALHQMSLNRIPTQHMYQDVLLSFYQVRDEVTDATGDKGIIESISARPLKVIFSDPDAKNTILENPFQKNIFS